MLLETFFKKGGLNQMMFLLQFLRHLLLLSISLFAICYLCLNEKLFINEHQGDNLLNQQNELFSKCRHRNKFKLMNCKT